MNCPRCGDRIRVARFDGTCRTCGKPDYLQPWAVKCLREWSWTSWHRVGGEVPRDGPTEGFWCRDTHDPDRGPYVFACKNHRHSDNGLYRGRYASFSKTILGAARPLADDWRKVVLFAGPGPYTVSDAWVFDPRRVVNQATEHERNRVDSKRERDVEIFDVSAQAHGVPLGDHLSGAQRLPGPTGDGLRPTTLKAFGVERGEV